MKYKKMAAILTAATIFISTTTVAFAETPFTDIEKNWAKTHIISVNEKGLMNGTTSDKFSPDTAVNKYSAIISIARMMGIANMDLSDITAKHKELLDKYKVPDYAQKEISFCLEKNVLQGEIDLLKFSEVPNATKLDISIYLGRAFGIEHDPLKPPVQLSYNDTEKIPRPYRIYVDHMIKIGIVDGKGDTKGLFNPDTPVTRAMFAKMLDLASAEYVSTTVSTEPPVVSVPSGNTQTPPKDEENIDVPINNTDNGTKTTTKDQGIIDTITYTRNAQPKIVLENESKSLTEYTLPADLIKENVIINGQLSDIYSLRPGLYVEVEVISGKIDKISTVDMTKRVNIQAIVKQVDLLNSLMIVDVYDVQDGTASEKKVFMRDAKIGDMSFNLLSLDALSPGQSINLIGIEDMEGIKAQTVILNK